MNENESPACIALYSAALTELDPKKLLERINLAESALESRLFELYEGDYPKECQFIDDALRTLVFLRRSVRNTQEKKRISPSAGRSLNGTSLSVAFSGRPLTEVMSVEETRKKGQVPALAAQLLRHIQCERSGRINRVKTHISC